MTNIELRNISKYYHQKCVLENVSLTLQPAKYHLTGNNGSGKTTLLSLIAGLEIPSSGQVTIQSKVDFSSDKFEIPPLLTVANIFALYDKYDRCKSELRNGLVKTLDFESFVYSKYEDLSEGTKQKLKLILAFSGVGEWLLLDEPANALDAKSISLVKSFIKNTNRPVIVIDHSGLCIDESFQKISLAGGSICIKNSQAHC